MYGNIFITRLVTKVMNLLFWATSIKKVSIVLFVSTLDI